MRCATNSRSAGCKYSASAGLPARRSQTQMPSPTLGTPARAATSHRAAAWAGPAWPQCASNTDVECTRSCACNWEKRLPSRINSHCQPLNARSPSAACTTLGPETGVWHVLNNTCSNTARKLRLRKANCHSVSRRREHDIPVISNPAANGAPATCRVQRHTGGMCS